jgi:hypothetical protein
MKQFYFQPISQSRFAPPSYDVKWGEVYVGMIRKTALSRFVAAYQGRLFANSDFASRADAANWLRDMHTEDEKKKSLESHSADTQ